MRRAGQGRWLTVMAAWAPPYQLDRILPHHILLQHDHSAVAIDENRPVRAPKPQGMSGGPVWRSTFFENRVSSKLVGLAIEYRPRVRCLVVSRIGVALNLIRNYFPDLAIHLPIGYEPPLFNGSKVPYDSSRN